MRSNLKRSICLLLAFIFIFSCRVPSTFANSIVGGFVKVTDVSQSYGKVTIRYTVLKDIPSNVGTFFVGYDYPSIYRTSGRKKEIPAGTKRGTYSTTLDVALIGNFTVITELLGRYSETIPHKTYFNAPTSKTVTYHEVGTVGSASAYVIYYAIPGLYFTFYPGGKLFKVVGGAYAGATTYSGFKASLNASSGFPLPVKGHYYKTESWYENSKIYTKTTVWTNKESFNKNISSIYSGTVSMTY